MTDLDDTLRCVLDEPARQWRSCDGLRDAAVLAPLVRHAGQDWLVFTQRRDDLQSHAGEMSFPGGSREGDEDARTCALRESWEEIGVAPDRVEVLGRLPELESREGYRVACFVGRIPSLTELRPDPTEVAAVVPIPMVELRRAERWQWRDWRRRDGHIVRIPFFDHDGHTVWGLTGMLTQQLLRRLA